MVRAGSGRDPKDVQPVLIRPEVSETIKLCTTREEADYSMIVNCRGCVGKNLANMQLQIFIATIFRRYTFVLENPEKRVSPSRLARPFPTD